MTDAVIGKMKVVSRDEVWTLFHVQTIDGTAILHADTANLKLDGTGPANAAAIVELFDGSAVA